LRQKQHRGDSQNFPPNRFTLRNIGSHRNLLSLPQLLEGQQGDFARTAEIHAARIFDLDGASKVVREDIGRHMLWTKRSAARFSIVSAAGSTCSSRQWPRFF